SESSRLSHGHYITKTMRAPLTCGSCIGGEFRRMRKGLASKGPDARKCRSLKLRKPPNAQRCAVFKQQKGAPANSSFFGSSDLDSPTVIFWKYRRPNCHVERQDCHQLIREVSLSAGCIPPIVAGIRVSFSTPGGELPG